MKAFAALYAELDASTSTRHKVQAMQAYFAIAPAADAAWAAYFLAGGKPRQTVPARDLREAARKAAGLPEWLFEESYQAVGDLAETIAHLLPPPQADDDAGLAQWMHERLLPLRGLPPVELHERLRDWWSRLDWSGRFVMNKLITGGLRVGVSRLLVIRALAGAFEVEPKRIAPRIVGYTSDRQPPDAEAWRRLVAPADADEADASPAHPYPFFLSQQLQQPPQQQLGAPDAWLVEWKWDGIRAQLVRRGDGLWLWSRGEELITEGFPELAALLPVLPAGTVLDGEVVAWDAAGARPMNFAALQTRISRKRLTARALEQAPAVLLAFDLLEQRGEDLRTQQLAERRRRLAEVVDAAAHPALRLSERVVATDWDAYATLRAQSRARGVEGFMLKRLDSAYGVGRTKTSAVGEWWKWKIDPLTVDAVLVYAQRGHGRRASLYTDYTFAVWDTDPDGRRVLVPFAKAYSGLTDAEIARVDAAIRRTTVERFGPVRSVTPTMVFELGFEGIQRSPRHKSGIAVRFPRILRWRHDKPVDEADTLESLRALLT